MAKSTTNFNLQKPLDNETADIAVINENMDKIDEALKQNADGLNTKETPKGAQSKADIAEKNAKAYADSIKPTKLSELTNDSGYITESASQSKANKAESNAKVYADQEIGKVNKNLTAHLNDDAKHFTKAEKEKLAGVQEGATNYKHPSSHPASMITGLHDVATSGDYRELKNKPTSLPASGGNASTVNGHTVNANVPSDAKFTDTNTHRAISDSVTSTSTSTAASSKAAKTAYDRGSSALSKANSAYSKAEQAFQSASNGKKSVAAAITGMGQSASSGDTFSTLATKIKNISKDANASTSHVLSGKTFYQGGVKRTGTMPSRSGGYNTDSLTRSGNTLRMSIPDAGYYSDGAYVQYKDNDWVESNIKKGVNIFGKTGRAETVSASVTKDGENRLYRADSYYNKTYEINPDNFSVISSSEVGGTGVGGTSDVICACNDDYVYKLNPDSLVVIDKDSTPGSYSAATKGVGGMADRLYFCTHYKHRIYEINPNTLANIGDYYYSDGTAPTGIGGTAKRLFYCDTDTDYLYEVNPDDLYTEIKKVSKTNPSGVGGVSNRLYFCKASDTYYELNTETLLSITSHSLSAKESADGIGGMKGFTQLKINSIIGISNPEQINYLEKTYILKQEG